MAGSTRFKILLALALIVTLGSKAFITANVGNPSDREIVEGIVPFFERSGFEVAATAYFAGRDALIARKGDCLIYAVPVAHQGWHQATVRQSVDPASQKLDFVFRGRLTADRQERWYPLLVYYTRKVERYVGLDADYPPLVALVSSGRCDLAAVDWDRLPSVPFHRLSIGNRW